ncbi:hypothetical protein BGZ51_004338 [Haplosporangium sp. Z 767]|nr:hypothetical protein BGZ51_004338 [Haplosporangium sp. Z 767]
MSNDHQHVPFSAEVLDNLGRTSANTNNGTDNAPMTLTPPTLSAPPSFDSFPDIRLPVAKAPTAVSDVPPIINIPNFPSFPVDSLSSAKASFAAISSENTALMPSSADTTVNENTETTRQKTKEKKKSKHDKKEQEDRHSRDNRDRYSQKTRVPDERHAESRERRKERKRSKSRSRERHSRHYRDEKSGDHDRDRHRYRDSRKRESSRDRYSNQHSHRDRKDQKRDRDTNRERDRAGNHGTKYESGRPRDASKSPDRKKSRLEDKNIESWSIRRDRDRELDRQSMSGSSKHEAATSWNKKNPGEWVIDLSGDRDWYRYGSLDPLTVPRYTRTGGGRVLGLPNHWRIDYEKTRALGGKGIVMRIGGRGSKAVRYSDPNATWRDQSSEYKRISRAKAEKLASTLDLARQDNSYIPLDIRAKSKQTHADESDEEEQDADHNAVDRPKVVDFRDIHGKSVYKDEDEDLLQTTSDQEEEGAESALEVLIRRRVLLDSQLRKDPKQPNKWLEYIAVEDEIYSISSRRSKAHSEGHSEVKLSIFERALQSNPTNQHLLLEYMNTCRQCWQPAKVLTKWDELVQSTPILTAWPGLWVEYLDYRQRHFLSFSVKSFINVLNDALDRLGQLARSTWLAMQSVTENAELQAQLVKIECVLVHVIVRAWTFLKQAGYPERAQGILQGQVEFLFNIPSSLASEPWHIQIGSLEEFWDSELPRFGEKDAKGWSHYVTVEDEVEMVNQFDTLTLPSMTAPHEELLEALAENNMDRYLYGRWAKIEKELNATCWFPIRTTDDLPGQLEDDPYGIVLFDDIRPFIVSLYSQEARLQFLDCLMTFLGLPINSFAGSNGPQPATEHTNATKTGVVYNPYFHDGLLLNVGMDIQLNQDANPGLNRFFPQFETKEELVERTMKEIEQEYEFREPEQRDWNCVWNLPLRIFPQSMDAIFSRTSVSESKMRYPWATVTRHEEMERVNRQLIRNTIQQLMDVIPLPKGHQRTLSLHHLMFETVETMSGSKSQKLAKKYLKSDRMDLELWNGYAQAEKALGRIPEARKVYSTVLSMYRSFPAGDQERAPLIHHSYAQLEWEQGRRNIAIAILVALAEGAAVDIPGDDTKDLPMVSITRLVKARQVYAQKVAQLNLVRPWGQADVNVIGGKWFEPAMDWIISFAWFEYLCSPPGTGVGPGIKIFERAIQELDFRNPDMEIEVPVDALDPNREQPQETSIFRTTSVSLDSKMDKPTRKRKISTRVETEMLWIQLAKLVYFHSLQATIKSSQLQPNGSGGYQPRDLRHIVRSGLERFPNNTILQSLLFWTEAQQRLYGRVWNWVHEQVSYGQVSARGQERVLGSKAPIWMFGLFFELWHQVPYNSHAIRSILESALESSKATSLSPSPNLWMIYIEFELRESARQQETASLKATKHAKKSATEDKKKSVRGPEFGVESSVKVKQLLMRALTDCPWCKDLYMLAFEPRMRKLFSVDELEQLYQTMLEKEIRVRHDIPERTPAQEQQSVQDADVDMSDRDISK